MPEPLTCLPPLLPAILPVPATLACFLFLKPRKPVPFLCLAIISTSNPHPLGFAQPCLYPSSVSKSVTSPEKPSLHTHLKERPLHPVPCHSITPCLSCTVCHDLNCLGLVCLLHVGGGLCLPRGARCWQGAAGSPCCTDASQQCKVNSAREGQASFLSPGSS